MIKNAFDWSSGVVKFITNENRTEIRYVDDGCGMSEKNRSAFLSLALSNARGEQSGTFGTGAKYMIISHSSHVRVLTAPQDEPDLVYVMEFTPSELIAAYSSNGTIEAVAYPKSPETWPYESRFGTEITYTLKDPSSRGIYRGAQLAQKLSDRLDNVLVDGGMVLVDGQKLPKKQLAPGSRLFVLQQPAEANPTLGRIKLEFYRPAKKSSDEDLRMTDRSIGEVSFRDVFVKQLLTDDHRAMVPPLFLEGEVCGLITAGFLHDHVDESRDRYKVSVADDERVNELLRLLHTVQADVATHLGIKLKSADTVDARGKAEVEELIDRLRQRYDASGDVPPGSGDGETPDPDKTTSQKRKPPAPGLPYLKVDRPEYELDETITVTLVVPNGDPSEFKFHWEASKAKLESQEDGKLVLRASELGRGLVTAINPRTGELAKTNYEIVLERRFHLSARLSGISMGSQFTVVAVNSDRLKGEVNWKLENGYGQLKVAPRGQSATFIPSKPGRALIAASDSLNPEVSDVCDLRVHPAQSGEAPLRIRDQFFTVVWSGFAENAYDFRKLATIVYAGSGEVHRLYFNLAAPGYEAALKSGGFHEIVAYALAYEFAKHFCIDYDELDSSDVKSVMLSIQNEASLLFEEMLGK
ncbi:MAG TPA: hypothetical protein VG992_01795 [Candidatus Saccharimonadales bacterium]|nr:hypothetical protein [Candidatus Saccharimonadales bacterium]